MCLKCRVSGAIQQRCGTSPFERYQQAGGQHGKCSDLKNHLMLEETIGQAAMPVTPSHTLLVTIFISVSFKHAAAELVVTSALLSA